MIFPNFSIGPELDLLFYQNKAGGGLAGHFLRQDQLMFKAQYSFDWTNLRNSGKQLKHAPPSSAK